MLISTRLLALLFFATGSQSAVMAQTCRSESEIPSSTPLEDFVGHGDGTITHTVTGLMWMKCLVGKTGVDCSEIEDGVVSLAYTWGEALNVAASSGFAGHTDWRLPNINELRSIVEERCFLPAINLEVFPSISQDTFWSSSPSVYSSDSAWNIDFGYGNTGHSGTRHSSNYVRLVRDAN